MKIKKTSLFFNIFNLFIEFYKLYFDPSWEYSYESSLINNFKLVKGNLYKFKNKSIFISLKGLKLSGWYLLGIRHLGENNNLIGHYESSNLFFKQGRKMASTRIRWRIIHVPYKEKFCIKFTNVNKPIIFKNIYLFKIPYFNAKSRVIKKVINESPLLVSSKTNFPKYWKIYNKLLSPFKLSSNLINYEKWISIYENEFLKELKIKNLDKINYFYDKEKGLLVINRKKWLILKKPGINLNKIAIKAIFWASQKDELAQIFYGDEDYINKNGDRFSPIFKPSWNKELFLCNPNYSSLWIIDYDLYKKVEEHLLSKHVVDTQEKLINIISLVIKENKEGKIRHIPIVLGHNSYLRYSKEIEYEDLKRYHKTLQKINKNYLKNNVRVTLNKSLRNFEFFYKVSKNILISIIIPIKDNIKLLKQCLNSIIKNTTQFDLQIVIVNNNSIEKSTYDFLSKLKRKSSLKIKYKIINFYGEFNYSAINNYAFKYTLGEVIILLNNDVKILTKNWQSIIASYALREDVGCVGIKLLYPDDTIQHAGIIVGIYGSAGYSHKNFKRYDSGHDNRLNHSQNISAVTGAFLAVKKDVWLRLNGLDDINFPVNYNDVDFCLRANQIGLKNIYLPQVEAIHFESKTRGKPTGKIFKRWKKEHKFFRKKWQDIINQDPCYSSSLTKIKEDWSLNLSMPNFNLD